MSTSQAPGVDPDVGPQVEIINLPSEVDLQTAPAVRDALMASLNRCPHLVVDATSVSFMDSSGINALVRAKERADRLDGSLHVVATTRPGLRVLAVTQLERVLGVVPTVSDAVRCVSTPEPMHSCQPTDDNV